MYYKGYNSEIVNRREQDTRWGGEELTHTLWACHSPSILTCSPAQKLNEQTYSQVVMTEVWAAVPNVFPHNHPTCKAAIYNTCEMIYIGYLLQHCLYDSEVWCSCSPVGCRLKRIIKKFPSTLLRSQLESPYNKRQINKRQAYKCISFTWQGSLHKEIIYIYKYSKKWLNLNVFMLGLIDRKSVV